MTFAQAAEAHLDDVYGYLAWFTSDRFAAEELTGETFERALAALAPLRPPPRVGADVALPGGADGGPRSLPLRTPTRPPRAGRRPAGADRGSFVEGLSPDLELALRHLTAGEREVLVLRIVLELDAGTTAGILGISPTNCTTRLNRALKKLEEALHVAA